MKLSCAYLTTIAGLSLSGCVTCKDTTYYVTTQESFQWTDLAGTVQEDETIAVPATDCFSLCQEEGDGVSHFKRVESCYLELHPIYDDPTAGSDTTEDWIVAEQSSEPVELPADWPFDEPIIRAICTGEYFEACRH